MNNRDLSKSFETFGNAVMGSIGREPEAEPEPEPSTGMGALTEGVFCLCLIVLMIMGVVKLGMIWF